MKEPMHELTKKLFELREEAYSAQQAKITPSIPAERFIGVRVPKVRELAEAYRESPEAESFLAALPHFYFDENMLHGVLLSGIRDYQACLRGVETFLPFVDNWAVCDSMSPKVFKKHRDELIGEIQKWLCSDHVYTCRFGVTKLMDLYLDDGFKKEYPELIASVRSEEYYVRMACAWYFATALAKQWEAVIPFIEEKKLDPWVHNKSIQKARESFRVPDERKAYLKTLKL